MKIAIGLVLLIVGVGSAGAAFIFNSQTPLQLGPVPFFGGAIVALIGLIFLISGL